MADFAELSCFREVVKIDFEFTALPGERPVPVCCVAHELRSGRRFRIFEHEFGPVPPYATGPDVLVVTYYASAELGCYLARGWPMPEHILDLFAEFRCLTNMATLADQHQRTPVGAKLLGALAYFGLSLEGAEEKKEFQEAIGNGTWRDKFTPEQILNYCEGDVVALHRLLQVMAPQLDLGRALLRGRYMAAAAVMEHNGIPIDVDTLALLRQHWEAIQDQLITDVDKDFGVYEGRTFKTERFAAWLTAHNIPWPRLASGVLALDDETFKSQATAYPCVAELRELRKSLAELRLNDLAVGRDGRNRTILSAFRSKTGRNQPSNTKYIFGPSKWARRLMKPPPPYALGYADWSQQEFGIAAALSGDGAMQEAYMSGDPYLAFGKQAKAIPSDATKDTHKGQRELFKACVLGVQYGMGESTLAQRIGQSPIVGRDLLRAHRETYPQFWRWSDAAVDTAMLTGSLHTVFGWQVHVGETANPRSLRNFPMQANGAEMLRLACCLATERGIEVCAPVHDAILIFAPLDRLEADIAVTRAAMAEASRIVLNGFELRTDVAITRWPDRYLHLEEHSLTMWKRVIELVQRADQASRRVA